jgi:hypothetical protein
MKRPLYAFLLPLVIIISCAKAFAGEPIPGVGIIVRTDPGDKVAETSRTGKDGKFSINLPAGNYHFTIVFNDVIKTLGAAKNWDGKSVTLSYRNSEIRTLVPLREVLTKNSLPLPITVHGTSVTIDGAITYDVVAASAPADKK